MANKVASKRWIYSNFSVGSSSNECATKTEILGFGLYITNDSSYASNQLVREEDIYLPAWTYSFSVSNWDKNVGESGGTTSSISISSSKSRLGTTESVGWSIDSSTVPSWITWNSSDMTFTVASNSSTSSRTADIYFEQDESGKRDYARVTQAEATPTTTYTFSVNPYKVNVGSSGGSGSVTITSYKTVGYNTYDVDYSIDSSTLPSWVSFNKSTSTFTIQSTTSTVGRTAKVYFDQDESGKRDYAEITQTGYTPPVDTYVFTWFDGSTSDVSASFPWDFSANGTAAANIPVVSTKNGSSQSWSVSSKPSWITTSTTSSKVTISASDNSGSARSGTIVLTQSGSNKTLRINVTQAAKPAENVYVFTITPNTYDVPYSGASFIPRTVSTKNGSKIGYSLTSGETDWVVVTIDSKVTVEILKNTTSSTRSTTLVFTQNESGKTQSIKITQSGQQDEYILSMWPESNTSGSYPADAQNTNIEVRSLRNGQKHQIGVKSQPLWCTAYISRSDDSGIYYIDLAIQGNSMIISREDTIVFEQEDSGKTTSYTVSQSGSSSQDNKLTITSVTYEDAYLFPPGITPVVGSEVYLKVMLPNTFTWKTSSGLAINRGTAYAGDICNIYVFENSRYKLVKSFKLQTGKQTVNI
jgi:hypothetical protein